MASANGIFNIPASNFDWFSAQIAKLSKRSVRLLGEQFKITPVVFSHEDVETNGLVHRTYQVLLNAEEPKLAGWEFVAKLDHANEVGNIVRVVPGKTLPEHYRTADHTNCDHCKTKRYRRDTYVVREIETNQFRQIGSSCLKDFIGHDVEKIAKLAELLTLAGDLCRAAGERTVGQERRLINLETYLGIVSATIRQHGWMSRADAKRYGKEATADIAANILFTVGDVVYMTERDKEVAAAALEWVQDISEEKRASNDYLYNIYVIAASGIIEPRSIGFAASIIGSYLREQQRAAPKNASLDNITGIVALLERAGSKLKHPKLIVSVEGHDLRLSVAGPRSNAPGAINVTSADGDYEGREWYGRIHRDGRFQSSNRQQAVTSTAILSALRAFAADPAGIAAAYGKKSGNCCFCSIALTDARSLEVGYGKICAGHYGLPYPKKAAA